MRLDDDALREIVEKAKAATLHSTKGYELIRYDHGGGRACVIGDDRTLLADFYHAPERELWAALPPESAAAMATELLLSRALIDAQFISTLERSGQTFEDYRRVRRENEAG